MERETVQANVMDKNYQNTNSSIEAANDNETKKSEHAITAEISVEVTGEDEPTKYDKRRKRWAIVALWSFVALILSGLFFFLVNMDVYSFSAAMISLAVFIYSFVRAGDIDPEEEIGYTPWWYGGL